MSRGIVRTDHYNLRRVGTTRADVATNTGRLSRCRSRRHLIANSTLGKVEVFVSPETNLIDTGTAWLGKRSTVERRTGHRHGGTPVRPGAPVVRLGGHSMLGHVRVTIG